MLRCRRPRPPGTLRSPPAAPHAADAHTKFGPGTWWCSNLSAYSITFTPRNTAPRTIVRISQFDRRGALVGLRASHRHRHRQRAADQHGGVEAAPEQVERSARFRERVEVPDAVDHVGHEQPAEEQDFGEQEHPHPEDGSLLLLRHRVEVMLQRRMVRAWACRASAVRDRVRQDASPWRRRARTRRVRCPRSGVSTKFSVSGGDCICHSRPEAPHGLGPATCAVLERIEEVDHRQQVAEAEHGRARRRHHVQHLDFVRIRVVAARHAEVADHELREEREVEADEHHDGRHLWRRTRNTSGRSSSATRSAGRPGSP